ncbi:MAG: TonB-dependent receptor [Bacteroidota bacterium]
MNKHYTLFAIFLLLLLVTVGWAQPCNLTAVGRVVAATGEPLVGATVKLSANKGAITDAQGNFTLTDLCAAPVTVSVQYLGYQTQTATLNPRERKIHVIALEPERTELQEVVVREQLAYTELAHTATTLNEKQLSELAGKSLGETLKEVPGVNAIQAGPGIFKPVIHGVHSQRVLILNHGIRQEGQQWGAEHAPEIDPFIASDIVVIKDASAIKYGTDALGGVVVINPPALPESFGLGGSVQTVLQSNGRSGTVAGTLEGGLVAKGWGWRVQGSAKQAGDFKTPDYYLTNTGLKELNFSAATGYHSERGGAEIFFSRFQTEVGILRGTSTGNLEDLLVAMESDPPPNTGPFSYTIAQPRQNVSHDLLKLNGHWETDRGDWQWQYGFQNNQRKEYDVRRSGLSDLPAIDLQLFTHTLEAEWETHTDSKRSMCVGLAGMYQDNNNVFGTQRIPFIPNFNNLSAGVFGVVNHYWQRVSLDVGARYDYKHYNVAGYDFKNALYRRELSFHNLSATAGLTWKVRANRAFNASVSTAWRPPHVAELFSLGVHQSAGAIEYGLLLNERTNEVAEEGEVQVANEKAAKLVLSYKAEGKRLTWELSAYNNYISDYIFLRPTGITQNVRGTYPYFRYNQTDALFTGADASATWMALPGWKVITKASWLRARDVRNNDHLVFIPANRVEIAVRHEATGAWKGFFAEAKARYVFKQYLAPRTIPVTRFIEATETGIDPLEGRNALFDFLDAPNGYLLATASVGYAWQLAKVRYDFRASAENLANTEYREYTNRFRYYADELGRNFILSVKCIF